MLKFVFCLFLIFVHLTAFTHEGHNKVPGHIAAPHGGTLKGTTTHYFELVAETTGFKLYVFDHELKNVHHENLKIEGQYKFPKQKKFDKITFIMKDNSFETKIDAKGYHRYSVDLKVTYKDKTEPLSFSVEPKD